MIPKLKKIYKDKIFRNYNIVVTGSEGKLGKKIVDLSLCFAITSTCNEVL